MANIISRQQAIEVISNCKGICDCYDDVRTLIDNIPPVTQTVSDDCISRAKGLRQRIDAAIDDFEAKIKQETGIAPGSLTDWSEDERGMNNAEKFQEVFGYYATEMWAKPEKEFLDWINAEYNTTSKTTPKPVCEDAISRNWLLAYCKEKADHYRKRIEIIEEQGEAITYDPKEQLESFRTEVAIYESFAKEVMDAPPVEPERPKGEYVKGQNGEYYCSMCKRIDDKYSVARYCWY